MSDNIEGVNNLSSSQAHAQTSATRPMYTCPRCGYNTPHRYYMISHLRRKNPCRLNSNQRNDEMSLICIDHEKKKRQDEMMRSLLSELESSKGFNVRTRVSETTFACDSCNKVFNFRASLTRHRKTCHNHAEEEDARIQALQRRCDMLQEQMEDLRQRPASTNTTNNNNISDNSTTNNNIQINALGREDLSQITPQLVDTCIKRTTKGLVELMEKIHFDTNASNQNIRASLQHPEQVEYHDGDSWKYGPRNRVVRQVVDSSHLIMSNRYDDSHQGLRNSMSNAMFDFIDRWMQKMTRSNAQVYVDVMSEVYCAILNRSREFEDYNS